jgi:hypothetical protein
MNDQELESLLKSAPLPERPPEFWEQLPQRITAKIHWQMQRPTSLPTGPRTFAWWQWALGAGMVMVVGAVVFLFRPEPKSHGSADAFAAADKCYRETETLFPNQIQSIVFDEAGPHIVLSEKADVPFSPPLYLKICGPHGCQEIVTFSGQQVRVNGEVCDVLSDAAGNIILAGEHLIWSSKSPAARAGNYRIEARMAEVAL